MSDTPVHEFEFDEDFGACFFCLQERGHHNHTGNQLRFHRFLYDGCDPQPRCHCTECDGIRKAREAA